MELSLDAQASRFFSPASVESTQGTLRSSRFSHATMIREAIPGEVKQVIKHAEAAADAHPAGARSGLWFQFLNGLRL